MYWASGMNVELGEHPNVDLASAALDLALRMEARARRLAHRADQCRELAASIEGAATVQTTFSQSRRTSHAKPASRSLSRGPAPNQTDAAGRADSAPLVRLPPELEAAPQVVCRSETRRAGQPPFVPVSFQDPTTAGEGNACKDLELARMQTASDLPLACEVRLHAVDAQSGSDTVDSASVCLPWVAALKVLEASVGEVSLSSLCIKAKVYNPDLAAEAVRSAVYTLKRGGYILGQKGMFRLGTKGRAMIVSPDCLRFETLR